MLLSAGYGPWIAVCLNFVSALAALLGTAAALALGDGGFRAAGIDAPPRRRWTDSSPAGSSTSRSDPRRRSYNARAKNRDTGGGTTSRR